MGHGREQNTPVFFIRDGIKFSDFIHTQKRDPHTNLKSPTMMWDFWSLSPESLHQVTILFSDRGTPRGFRHMNGYSSHTFSLVNAQGQRAWCKWHFKTMQGIENFHREEAIDMLGDDPDFSTRDLFEAIERGEFPKWRVSFRSWMTGRRPRFPTIRSISPRFGRRSSSRCTKLGS